ncbi:MAG TPA: VOC family protein [Rhizobacter sp.]|nr:VOC family protein [Rhizobacter sp.]
MSTPTQIFVNLPVKDLPRSRAFFESMGYGFNPQFSNDQGACLVISDTIYAMLLTEPFFQTFTKKQIADAKKITEVLICLSCPSKAEVDSLIAKAVKAGGTTPSAAQDHGFMYSHSFEDLDGHVWELVHMDPNATPPNQG